MTLKSRHHHYQKWVFNVWLYHNQVHTLNEYKRAKLYTRYPRRGKRTGQPRGFGCEKFLWLRGWKAPCFH